MVEPTRDPSSSAKSLLKTGGLGAFITLLITMFWPEIDVVPQGAITVIGTGIGQSVGKEIRNFTFGKEKEMSILLSFLRVLGKFLI